MAKRLENYYPFVTKGYTVSKPTEKQLKYCHDIAWRNGGAPCDEDGQQ
jgi:hypothetical protein